MRDADPHPPHRDEQRRSAPLPRSVRRLGLIMLGFLLPTLLLYAAALPHFATTIPGSLAAQKDGWQNVWNLWWTAFALQQGQNPLFTTWLYYPEGISLFWQTLNVTNGLLALPITLVAGPVAAYNSLALASFVLSGLTLYLLARDLGASQKAAFVAGVLFSFSPLHVARLLDGQLEHMSIQWLPLYVLLLVRGLDRGSYAATLGAALVLLWITLTSLYQALACLVLLGLYALTLLLPRFSWPRVRSLAIHSGLLVGVWLLPLLGPLLGSWSGGAPDDDWIEKQALHSATPLDFVLPNPNHLLWGEAVSRFGQRLHPDAGGWNVAPGTTLLVLALVALLLSPKVRREPWPWMALSCMVLALGPLLVFNGSSTTIVLPYALINLLPAAQLGQRPNYLALPALLALALVAARGLDLLLAHSRRPALLLAGVGVVLLIDLVPAPLALTDATVPAVFAELSSDSRPGAVLELPFLPERSEPLQAQLVHQRPIMGGFVSRTPYYPFPLERPALQALWTGEEPRELIRPVWYETAGSLLRHYGIRYIVVRWRELPADARARLSTRLSALPQGTLQQRYDFQGLSIYEVMDRKSLVPFAFLRGAYAAEQNTERTWQWLGERAELVLVNPDSVPRGVVLGWQAEAFRTPRELEVARVQPRLPAQPLIRLGVGVAPSAGSLRLLLPPGETTLQFSSSAEPASIEDARRLGIAFTRLAVEWSREP